MSSSTTPISTPTPVIPVSSGAVLKETRSPLPSFKNNKPSRSAFNWLYIFTIIMILVSVSLAVGTVWLAMGFQKDFSTSYFDPNSGDEYTSYKLSVEIGLGLCAATCVLLIIMLVLYFVYLEEGFTFSQRLSNNLAVASQGTDRLRKMTGLMSGLVYRDPNQSVERANYANSLMNHFINTYMESIDMTPERRRMLMQQYRDQYTNGPAAASDYVPPSDTSRAFAAFRGDMSPAVSAAQTAADRAGQAASTAGQRGVDIVAAATEAAQRAAIRAGASAGQAAQIARQAAIKTYQALRAGTLRAAGSVSSGASAAWRGMNSFADRAARAREADEEPVYGGAAPVGGAGQYDNPMFDPDAGPEWGETATGDDGAWGDDGGAAPVVADPDGGASPTRRPGFGPPSARSVEEARARPLASRPAVRAATDGGAATGNDDGSDDEFYDANEGSTSTRPSST